MQPPPSNVLQNEKKKKTKQKARHEMNEQINKSPLSAGRSSAPHSNEIVHLLHKLQRRRARSQLLSD